MFNHTTLEADIARLSREVAEKKASPEHRDFSNREVLRRVLEPAVKNQPAAAVAPSSHSSDDNSVLPVYLSSASDDVRLQVERLVDEVFHRGLDAAVADARLAKNPFILDAFHDALTDKLYEELQRRKLI